MPVIFITDALIFLLLFMVIGFALYARTQEHLRAPWREVVKRPIAMSSAVVLSLFVLIGLLDSLHFYPKLENTSNTVEEKNQYSNEVLSVLDVLLTDIRIQTERTYSAPLATHAYAKEQIELGGGVTIRDYPRLKYGGVHLDNIEEEYIFDDIKGLK